MKTPVDMLCERFEQLKTARSNYEPQWRAIKDLVRPAYNEFGATNTQTTGQRKHDRVYDGTAPWANEQLAGGLHAYLTSPTDRWFSFAYHDKPSTTLSIGERSALESAADTLYHYFSMQSVGFNPASHELYLDICAFGTAVMYCFWNPKTQSIRFKSYPLTDVWIDENDDNQIDTVFRNCNMSLRQIMQLFPQSVTKEMAKEEVNKRYDVIHAVFPRRERDLQSFDAENKAYTSVYFIPMEKVILDESGYDTFPYIVPRWSKLSGEVYGRSPAMTCLPDVQMINHMMKEMIISAQLSNRPPIIVDEDSMFPNISFRPGAILTKSVGSEFPQPLMSGANPQITFDMMNYAREHIRSSFFIDFLKQDFKKERQTAYEVADKRDEKLMMLSPILSRLESEYLAPLLNRAISLIKENTDYGRTNAVFARNDKLKIFYTSVAARAQLSGKATQISRFLEELVPVANIFPNVLDKISPERLIDEMSKLRSVNPTILRTETEMEDLKKQQQEQQQMAQAAEVAPAAATAMRDVATAQNLQANTANANRQSY